MCARSVDSNNTQEDREMICPIYISYFWKKKKQNKTVSIFDVDSEKVCV